MDLLVADLEANLERSRQGGGPKAAERMRSRGKKLPRERSVLGLLRLSALLAERIPLVCRCYWTRIPRS